MTDDPKARIRAVLAAHSARETKEKDEALATDKERVSGFAEFSRVRAEVIKPALLALAPGIEALGYSSKYEESEPTTSGSRSAFPTASARFILTITRGSDRVVATLRFNNHGSGHVGTYEEVRGPGSQSSESSGTFSHPLKGLTQEIVQGAVAAFVEKVIGQLSPPRA